MENRIGLVAIVVQNPKESAEKVNGILSEFGDIIIGRMGLPYEKRGVCLISVMVDGSNDAIGALCGKLGKIQHVSVKSLLTARKE